MGLNIKNQGKKEPTGSSSLLIYSLFQGAQRTTRPYSPSRHAHVGIVLLVEGNSVRVVVPYNLSWTMLVQQCVRDTLSSADSSPVISQTAASDGCGYGECRDNAIRASVHRAIGPWRVRYSEKACRSQHSPLEPEGTIFEALPRDTHADARQPHCCILAT